MKQTFLMLGTNSGNRKQLLEAAKQLINKKIGLITKESSIYESEPWGFDCEQQFLNQAIEVKTNLFPEEILKIIHEIEKLTGRVRNNPAYYESRTMDIDILFFDNCIYSDIQLKIPHNKLHLRRFVLQPLSEIAPNYKHPLFEKTIKELLSECLDNLKVELFEKNNIN